MSKDALACRSCRVADQPTDSASASVERECCELA